LHLRTFARDINLAKAQRRKGMIFAGFCVFVKK